MPTCRRSREVRADSLLSPFPSEAGWLKHLPPPCWAPGANARTHPVPAR